MEVQNYSEVKKFLHDKELIQLLCYDLPFSELLNLFIQDDFLVLDPKMKVPFFAEIRDYKGAYEKDHPENQWLIKKVSGKDLIMTEMAMIVYFLDVFTRTVSVPVIITKINGEIYKATKTINQAEQLSGANYTVVPELREQLLLDTINRWIYCDEDRNPNNYMIKYNSKNRNIVLAIDFGNTDLLYKGMKVKGMAKQFGWERKEKTRYLTPLKFENFTKYGMDFYEQRFRAFNKLNSTTLKSIASKALRYNEKKEELVRLISNNILRRRDYVYRYFKGKIPEKIEESNEYSDMGKSFQKFYS